MTPGHEEVAVNGDPCVNATRLTAQKYDGWHEVLGLADLARLERRFDILV